MRLMPRIFLLCAAILTLALFPLSVEAADVDRALLQRTPPVYPELARQMHLVGDIVLELSVDPDGRVREAKIVSGHPMLAGAAQRAVKEWRYAAAPEPTQQTVRVTFK